MPDASVLAAAMRSDLAAFIQKAFQTVSPEDRYRHNWHIEAIAYQLGRCWDRQCRRLIITQPPRSLKSICASVAFVAWALGRNPKLRFICVSYSDALAAALARQFRQVVNSGWYRALFPGTRLSKDTGIECVTTAGGGRLATSIGGTLTGRGADMIIVDDPLKAGDASSKTVRDDVNEWYTTALVSRLNDKARDVMIVLMQRLHEDDLAGPFASKRRLASFESSGHRRGGPIDRPGAGTYPRSQARRCAPSRAGIASDADAHQGGSR